LQEAVERELTLDLRDTLRSRRAKGWRLLDRLRAGEIRYGHLGNVPATPRAWIANVIPVNVDGDAADFLRGMNRLMEKATPPDDGRHDELLAFTKAWQEDEPFLGGLIQGVEQAVWEHYWSQTYLRRALVGIAAERYRQKHGNWPIALDALVQAGYLKNIPLDPFNGRAMVWTRRAEGASIDTSQFGSFRLWDPPLRRQPPPPVPE
jgi:hypothetical protein